MNNQYNVAMSWLNRGIATIPIMYRSKRPNFSALYTSGDVDNKGKPTWDRMKTELPTVDNLRQWYRHLSNIAVVCGWRNLVIVDFDRLDAHDMWLALYPSYTATYTVSTGRGYHYYYYINDPPPHTLKWWGGDVKVSGYCLAPDSVHPSGRVYRATNQADIMTIESINEILPESVFEYVDGGLPCIPDNDPFAPTIRTSGGYTDINEKVSITRFFSDYERTGDNWLRVKCPLHDDRKPSAWLDTRRNRFGCHKCINGSLSVIDFYAQIQGISTDESVRRLKEMI